MASVPVEDDVAVAYQPLTTRQIIEELRLEHDLRRLPDEVHHAVYRWVLNKALRTVKRGIADECITLMDEQRALAAAHPTYIAFAERALARWIVSFALQLEEGVERELRKRPYMRKFLGGRPHDSYVATARHCLTVVVLVNAERERDPLTWRITPRPSGWPFFTDCLRFSVEDVRSSLVPRA